jgi:inorganic pyrophosphatase
VYPGYAHIEGLNDVPQHWRDRISYFFEHYKDLEAGKWVKVLGWEGPESAKKEVLDGIEAYKKAHPAE